MRFHIHVDTAAEIHRIETTGKTILWEGNLDPEEVKEFLKQKLSEWKINRSGCNNMKDDGSCAWHYTREDAEKDNLDFDKIDDIHNIISIWKFRYIEQSTKTFNKIINCKNG